MIEAIREIGEKVLEGDSVSLLDNLILDVPSEVKGKKQYLLIINYKLIDRSIDIDFEEIKDDTSKKYLWVGNADAANSPQIYFTTNNISYLLSQTIPNVIQVKSENSSLGKILRLSLKEMFINLGFSGRGRYLLNWQKVRILGKKLDVLDDSGDNLKKEYEQYKKLTEIAKKDKNKKRDKEGLEKGKNLSKKILKALELKIWESIKENRQLTKKDINLYTLKINDNLIVDDTEYREVVMKEKIDSLFAENTQRACSCCNEIKSVTDKPKFAKARSALGCYITDKVGFSSDLSGEFGKSFILCKECYKKLLVGEVFVRNNLSSRLAGQNLYIIPKFIFPITQYQKQLLRWAEYINITFNSVKTFEGIRAFQEKIEDYRNFENAKNNIILNFLFWKKGTGAETKVLNLIKDVPPTRLDILRRTTNEVKDIGDRVLGGAYQWMIDLLNIYFLIPLKKKQDDIEYRKILNLYDAIFTGRPISYRFLLKQFVELAQIYQFKTFGTYNLGKQQNSEIALVYAMLKANLLFLYLRKLNLLKVRSENMNYDSLKLDEAVKDFLKEMNYDGPKIALFLLGCLIGEIGNAQYVKGKSKPILGKITFQGMNKGKLIRLTNEVFEKLTEYKKLSFNEIKFAECKRLLDQNLNPWPLPDQDNVFYVLSGYAYATHQAIKAST